MPDVRNRTLDTRATVSGRRWRLGVWYTRSVPMGSTKTSEDIVGNLSGSNPFSLHELYKDTPCLDVTLQVNGTVTQIYENWPLDYYSATIPYPATAFPEPTTSELQDKGWQILAATNPGQSHVNVPQQLGELKDLPGLIRDWGRGLLADVARGHLTWRWCARPMISDIHKMLKFVESANKRFRELRRLRDVGYIKKRCSFGTDTWSAAPYNVTLHSNAFTIAGVRQNHFTRKSWGSVNWKVQSSSPLLDMEDRELMKFTRRTMLGLNGAGALEAAWELVPWSWFLDWFSNTGTLISASNNAVGCTWSRPCFMCTATTRCDIQVAPSEPSWKRSVWSGPFIWYRSHKARYPAVPIIPFPTPYMPTLTGKHWSILASLAALRLR